MKKTKIIFMISLLPYILLISYAIWVAIFGYDIYGMFTVGYIRTVYGIEAFQQVIIWYGLTLCIIPVLPVCLIYQIIYILLKIRKGIKTKHD